MKPSEVTESYWLYSGNPGWYSRPQMGTGKWIIYSKTFEELDRQWEIVNKVILSDGAPLAKSATAMNNPTQASHGAHVICVYVDNFKVEEKSKKVLKALRKAGIKGKVKFKRDYETLTGKYGPNSFWMYSSKGKEVKRYVWTQKKSS